MNTFKEETLEAIKKSGHKEKDVEFIGSKDGKFRIDLKKFKEISNFEYDSGFGAQHIASDLIIYFKDGNYIKRGEYDGSEWWEYNTPLKFKSIRFKSFEKVGDNKIMWDTLEEINNK